MAGIVSVHITSDINNILSMRCTFTHGPAGYLCGRDGNQHPGASLCTFAQFQASRMSPHEWEKWPPAQVILA